MSTRPHRASLKAIVLATSAAAVMLFVPAAAGAQPAGSTTTFVDVSVSTVWTAPDSPRPVDAPALTNPVDVPGWLDAMTPADKDELISDSLTQTQALYGRPVHVLNRQGEWTEVAVPGQPTPKNPLGYPGWVPNAQLVDSPQFAWLERHRPFAAVDAAPTASLYDDAGLSERFMELSFNTRLPVLARVGDAILVATPADGHKWLSADDATVYRSADDIPEPTRADLVRTAKMFLGKPYLWAGRAGYGFDCSGFTSTIYEAHGITIPRDAEPQALHGGATPVDRDDLRPGDILFYANDDGTGSIYHDAMYIGDGKVIEAASSDDEVTIDPADFGSDYWGAVRYLD